MEGIEVEAGAELGGLEVVEREEEVHDLERVGLRRDVERRPGGGARPRRPRIGRPRRAPGGRAAGREGDEVGGDGEEGCKVGGGWERWGEDWIGERRPGRGLDRGRRWRRLRGEEGVDGILPRVWAAGGGYLFIILFSFFCR